MYNSSFYFLWKVSYFAKATVPLLTNVLISAIIAL